MNYFIFAATFVTSMGSYSSQMFYIWFQHFINDRVAEIELSEDEAHTRYEVYVLWNFGASMILLPIFGYISDKCPFGFEILLVYGMHAVAVMAFTFLRSPSGPFVIFTLCSIRTLSGLQTLSIDSHFTKRLPGDVRGAMIGVQSFFEALGKILFAWFSRLTVRHFDHIFTSL